MDLAPILAFSSAFTGATHRGRGKAPTCHRIRQGAPNVGKLTRACRILAYERLRTCLVSNPIV
jgi:hypothetical protein